LPSALEGLPITLLEAMSHGRPCIASDIPPHLGVIRNGINGFLHRAGDIDHLRQRMEEMIHAAPQDLAAVGQAARATVAEEYDWDDVTDQTERLYYAVRSASTDARGTNGHALAPKRSAGKL
jgi:glycosyltransferase involved in cell wall biosynthesis